MEGEIVAQNDYVELDAVTLCAERAGVDFDTAAYILEVRDDFHVAMEILEEGAASLTFDPDAARWRYPDLFPEEALESGEVYPDRELTFVALESGLSPTVVAAALLAEREYLVRIGLAVADWASRYDSFLRERLDEIVTQVEARMRFFQ